MSGLTRGSRPVCLSWPRVMPYIDVISEPAYVVGTAAKRTACGSSSLTPAENHATGPPKHALVYRLPPECRGYEELAQKIAVCTAFPADQRGAVADDLDARRRAWADESEFTRDNAREGLAST